MTSEATAEIGHNNPPEPTITDRLREAFASMIRTVDELAAEATKAREGLGPEQQVTADEQLGPLVDIGKRAGKLSKQVDATRLEANKPHRAALDETNQFFNALSARMDRVEKVFLEITTAYDRKKRDEERRRAADAAAAAQAEANAKMSEAAEAQHSVVSDVVLNEAVQAHDRAEALTAKALDVGTGPTRTEGGTISSSKTWTFAVTDWSKVNIAEFADEFTVAEKEKAIRAFVRKNKNTKSLSGVRIYQDERTSFR